MEQKEPKRFQHCTWYEKLWRCRWYICVPFYAFYLWITSAFVTDDETEEQMIMPFWLCWACSLGKFEASKMHYYYTTEEVFAHIKDKYDIDFPANEEI